LYAILHKANPISSFHIFSRFFNSSADFSHTRSLMGGKKYFERMALASIGVTQYIKLSVRMSSVNEKLRRSTLLLLSCYASLSLFILALSFWWSVSSVLRSPKRKKFSYIIFMSQSIEVYIACLSMRFRTVAGELLSLRELVSVLAVCNVIRSFNAK